SVQALKRTDCARIARIRFEQTETKATKTYDHPIANRLNSRCFFRYLLLEKNVSASRRNQHASRVCSPVITSARLKRASESAGRFAADRTLGRGGAAQE